ncbi:MAG: class I SAM-dependent methyltransferase [Chloroflexi bacterium]|nr:class I SAM-dependent methyltransferase [Chloroflexota bacterium]
MKKVDCNLCDRDDWRMRYPATVNGNDLDVDVFRCTNPGYGHHAQIVQCNHCGFVYANPRWSNEELLEAYTAVEDTSYLTEREGRELTFSKHLQALEKYTGPANGRSLLDIGAYIGVFVETAVASGWDAWGVEPSAWAAAEAQKQGLNVILGDQDALELRGRQFDVVTMWDVIEHVDDPSDEITKAYQLLNPGGWLILHTMDVDSLAARLMKSRWPWLMDMHLYYFSQKTLAQMLVQNGYEVMWSGAQGRYLRLGYLTTRVQAWNKPLGRLATGLVNGLRLNKIAVPINFGDLFTVYARKPGG